MLRSEGNQKGVNDLSSLLTFFYSFNFSQPPLFLSEQQLSLISVFPRLHVYSQTYLSGSEMRAPVVCTLGVQLVVGLNIAQYVGSIV